MLDALLSGVGGFGGADEFGNVPGKDHVLPLRLVRDRKVGVTREHGVNLDEVCSHRLDLVDSFSSFVRVADRDRTGLAERVGPVNDYAGGEYARADGCPGLDLRAPLFDRVERREHVPNTGDAVRNEEWEESLLV